MLVNSSHGDDFSDALNLSVSWSDSLKRGTLLLDFVGSWQVPEPQTVLPSHAITCLLQLRVQFRVNVVKRQIL